MQDRRKIKRKYIAFYSRVFDLKTGVLTGNLSDITAQGLQLISERPIETGSDFRFKIELPEDNFEQQNFIVDARSIWCQTDINPSFYVTGFELLNISPADLEIINRIMSVYGIRG